MKLQYTLPKELETVLRQIVGDEEILYSLPYDIDGDLFIEDGYLIVTRTKILRSRGSEILESHDLSSLSDFTAEKQYGGAGFLTSF